MGSTGKTHGMTLKMTPTRKAMKSFQVTSEAVKDAEACWAEGGGSAAVDWGGTADAVGVEDSTPLKRSGSLEVAAVLAGVISVLMANLGCSGGKQTLSSQAWKRILPCISTGPGFALD